MSVNRDGDGDKQWNKQRHLSYNTRRGTERSSLLVLLIREESRHGKTLDVL